MIMGLTPLMSLHNILILLIVFLLRVNLSTFFLGWAFFSGVAYVLDPLFDWIGLHVLTFGPLESLWTALYNITLWRIEKFNNSIVMGSLLFSLVLFVPLYLISNFAVRHYRDDLLTWVQRLRIVQALKGSKLYSAYQGISRLRGNS
jgi:uncharacterized protein (TIGR03546 family)